MNSLTPRQEEILYSAMAKISGALYEFTTKAFVKNFQDIVDNIGGGSGGIQSLSSPALKTLADLSSEESDALGQFTKDEVKKAFKKLSQSMDFSLTLVPTIERSQSIRGSIYEDGEKVRFVPGGAFQQGNLGILAEQEFEIDLGVVRYSVKW